LSPFKMYLYLFWELLLHVSWAVSGTRHPIGLAHCSPEPVGSSDLPASASQVAGNTGACTPPLSNTLYFLRLV
uniref:Uncharacterized protein n=1 Tax=Terrapene triunguis TaxID=2587831 RepID=A0A674JUV9_9SAUR